MPESSSGPMVKSNHAYQQPHYSPEAYINTRVAKPSHFRKAVSYIINDIADGEDVNILVLGCNCGENDLLPLIDRLKDQEKGSYHVTAIDDADGAIEEAAHRLASKGINLTEAKADERWTFDANDLEVTLLKEDIEAYPPEIFMSNYDIILSFFVFNHLTNWQLCVQRLCETLDEGGRLFVTQYDDPVTRGLENNPKLDERNDALINLLYQYHECRLDEHGVTYPNNFLGTRIEFLEEALIDKFDQEVICEVEYKVQTSEQDIIGRLGTQALHTPIYWGSSSENGDNKFEECLPDLGNTNDALRSYTGTLSLYKFTKTKDNCSLHSYVWDSNLRSILSSVDDKVKIPQEERDPGEIEEQLTILMQLLLGYQGLSRGVQFFTPLFWEVAVQDGIDIDLDSSPLTWRSLIASRNLSEAFNKYLNHLVLFRKHDVSDRQKERYSLAEVIFSRSETDINWVFAPTEKEFSCENIKSGPLRFFVIKIPMKYRNGIQNSNECFFTRGEARHRFNNFVCYDLSEVLENTNKKDFTKVQRLVGDKVLNQDLIDSENDLRMQKIQKAFKDSMWSHLKNEEKNSLAEALARRVSRFAYLVQLGACVYITNKLYDEGDGRASGNGGFFLCEEGVEVEDLRDQDSFLSQRYRFMKDVVNAYSRKTVLPHVEATRSRQGQWKAVGMKTLHNINSEITAAQSSVDEYVEKLDASPLHKAHDILETLAETNKAQTHNINSQINAVRSHIKEYIENKNDSKLEKARAILSNLHRKSQSIFTFQRRKEAGVKSYRSIDLREAVLKELKAILAGIVFNDKISVARRSAFQQCYKDKSFITWLNVEGEETSIQVEKSFTSGIREIIKNCVENTNPMFGVPMNISFSKDKVQLVITNSRKISEKILRFIHNYPRTSSEYLDIGFGLVVSLEIMEYCNVEYSVEVTDKENTVTRLLIPKQNP